MKVVTLSNAQGTEIEVLARGAIIRAIRVRDRNGVPGDVALCFDSIQEYERDLWYLGAVIGRYANRIAGGRLRIDDVEYQLACNDGSNHLHGGTHGFHAREWTLDRLRTSGADAVRLGLISPHGEERYPGTLQVETTYTLSADNELIIDYRARTDRTTVINLTQHTYFNLRGQGSGDVLDHQLTLAADFYLPVRPGGIPTGELAAVSGTPLDFRSGRSLRDPHVSYDHCLVLRKTEGELAWAGRLADPASGRTVDVFTTEPGLQLYTGQFLAPMAGKAGRSYDRFSGVCLETQHFPDSPNQPAFPSTLLRPAEEFASRTVYRFGVED